MQPGELTPERFSSYPPLAKQLATTHILLLQQLPLAFLPLLLREVIAYDWKFPAERRDLDNQFAYLAGLPADQLHTSMQPFAQLRLSPELGSVDWVNSPAQFSEKLTAHLWTTHQIEEFRTASVEYVHKLNAATPAEKLPTHRLSLIILGEGVTENRYPLFRKLRPQGVYLKNVNAQDGRRILLDAVAQRAAEHPAPFAHWYIDGATNDPLPRDGVTCMNYSSLGEVRATLVNKMRKVMQPGGGGPELLRTMLAQMRPEELGLQGTGDVGVLNHFQVSILTEGSGTQLFSTTFVQWSAREALRRAQPLTLLARFAPRLHEQSMRELIAGTQQKPVPDPQGSLIDADMGAYYTWINQQRLSGAEQSRFLVWFEGHNEALVAGPGFGRGVVDSSAIDLKDLVSHLT
ncbi:MAG: hypothetical protein JOY54_12800 [Acidobacteriaceae bacterium]|nr:hypothetical protein [Acidobacteriaceae bacterium]